VKVARIDHGQPGTKLPGGLVMLPGVSKPQRLVRAEATGLGAYGFYRTAHWWNRTAARLRTKRQDAAS
jgi:hypothetical protein